MSSNKSWLSVGITSFIGKIGLTFLFLLLALPAFAAGGACPSAASYGPERKQLRFRASACTSCYYVAANGSDSNSGTSEAAPWAHAPQMPSCSANCATVQNQGNGMPPGTGLILRGGDTWRILAIPVISPYTGGTWNFNSGRYAYGYKFQSYLCRSGSNMVHGEYMGTPNTYGR